MRGRVEAVVQRTRRFGGARLAAAVVGAMLLAGALVVPAAADTGTLVLSATPATLSAVDLTQPHAVGVTVSCPTPIGNLTVTLTRPGGTSSPLQPNVPVAVRSMFFDFYVSPAPAGVYVLTATSTGCGDAAPFTLTVTGPDVVTNLLTAPTQLSAAQFSTTGVTFSGTGYHTGATLQVASTVPGFVATTVTTDDSGAFTFTQTGSAATPDGYYSTTFTGTLDGTSYGTFLVGTAPPTTSNPVLSLSTDTTGGKITLSQFLATGVVATATGYAPGDLVLAFDTADASGNTYLRGNGPPDGTGTFSATLNGTGDLASDRLGVHTVTFQCFLGPDVTATFEVVPDPVVTVTAVPDPVEQGATVTIGADNLDPTHQYVILIDSGAGGFAIVTPDGDGNVSKAFALSASYGLGNHTATLTPVGVPTSGPAPSVTFSVVAGSTTTTSTSTTTTSTTTTSTSTTTSSTSTTSTTTTTTEPPTTTTTTTEPPTTTTTEPPTTTTTTEPSPSTSTSTTAPSTSSSTTSTTTTSTTAPSTSPSTTRPGAAATTTPPTVGPDVVVHVPGPSTPKASLAFTGARPERGALISAGLLVVGCACLFFASRRRGSHRS
jgi:hypothetical protein